MPDLQPLPPMGRFIWTAGRPVIRGLGRVAHSLQIEREGSLPEGPFVVAANHYSHFDPPLIGASVGRTIRFLAVDELYDESMLLAASLRWTGAIPLPRGRLPIGAVRTALGLLADGQLVGVFPEGTRVRRWGDHTPRRRMAGRAGECATRSSGHARDRPSIRRRQQMAPRISEGRGRPTDGAGRFIPPHRTLGTMDRRSDRNFRRCYLGIRHLSH